jgi:hypothetical protein
MDARLMFTIAKRTHAFRNFKVVLEDNVMIACALCVAAYNFDPYILTDALDALENFKFINKRCMIVLRHLSAVARLLNDDTPGRREAVHRSAFELMLQASADVPVRKQSVFLPTMHGAINAYFNFVVSKKLYDDVVLFEPSGIHVQARITAEDALTMLEYDDYEIDGIETRGAWTVATCTFSETDGRPPVTKRLLVLPRSTRIRTPIFDFDENTSTGTAQGFVDFFPFVLVLC